MVARWTMIIHLCSSRTPQMKLSPPQKLVALVRPINGLRFLQNRSEKQLRNQRWLQTRQLRAIRPQKMNSCSHLMKVQLWAHLACNKKSRRKNNWTKSPQTQKFYLLTKTKTLHKSYSVVGILDLRGWNAEQMSQRVLKPSCLRANSHSSLSC